LGNYKKVCSEDEISENSKNSMCIGLDERFSMGNNKNRTIPIDDSNISRQSGDESEIIGVNFPEKRSGSLIISNKQSLFNMLL
jgi:hypothetical protein